MQKPETRLLKKILASVVSEFPGFYFKVYGNAYQRKGLPDIIGCYHGSFVAIEVKMPGGKLTELQADALDQIKKHGGIAIVATSPDEAIRGIYKGIKNYK